MNKEQLRKVFESKMYKVVKQYNYEKDVLDWNREHGFKKYDFKTKKPQIPGWLKSKR